MAYIHVLRCGDIHKYPLGFFLLCVLLLCHQGNGRMIKSKLPEQALHSIKKQNLILFSAFICWGANAIYSDLQKVLIISHLLKCMYACVVLVKGLDTPYHLIEVCPNFWTFSYCNVELTLYCKY